MGEVLTFFTTPSGSTDEAGQLAIGCARGRDGNQFQAFADGKFATNNKFEIELFSCHMRFNNPSQRTFIRNRKC